MSAVMSDASSKYRREPARRVAAQATVSSVAVAALDALSLSGRGTSVLVAIEECSGLSNFST